MFGIVIKVPFPIWTVCNRKVVDGYPSTNNASESWISASKLDTIKMEKSLAYYKIIANVQGSECESCIDIVAACHNY